MSQHKSTDRVIIIGAGLSGLCLAQGLKKLGIPFSIYECDTSSSYRAQGYRVRIQNDGAQALKANLSPELFELFKATCAELTPGLLPRTDALTGEAIPGGPPPQVGLRGPGGPGGPPGPGGLNNGILPSARGPAGPGAANAGEQLGPYVVDRGTLREVLMTGLTVHFGKEFKSSETLEERKIVAHFADGTTSDQGALLVGADGIRSRVQQQYLPDHIPLDTASRCIYGKTPITPELLEKFPKQSHKGMSFFRDGSNPDSPIILFYEAMYFHHDSSRVPAVPDYVYWVLGANQDAFPFPDSKLLHLSSSECADLTLKMTEKWNPGGRALLELQDRSQTAPLRISSANPEMALWDLSAPVTLMGDSIHVMSPSGGSGANTALMDSQELCTAIEREGVSRKAVSAYEDVMRGYAKNAILLSGRGGKHIFNQKPLDECKPLAL